MNIATLTAMRVSQAICAAAQVAVDARTSRARGTLRTFTHCVECGVDATVDGVACTLSVEIDMTWTYDALAKIANHGHIKWGRWVLRISWVDLLAPTDDFAAIVDRPAHVTGVGMQALEDSVRDLVGTTEADLLVAVRKLDALLADRL